LKSVEEIEEQVEDEDDHEGRVSHDLGHQHDDHEEEDYNDDDNDFDSVQLSKPKPNQRHQRQKCIIKKKKCGRTKVCHHE